MKLCCLLYGCAVTCIFLLVFINLFFIYSKGDLNSLSILDKKPKRNRPWEQNAMKHKSIESRVLLNRDELIQQGTTCTVNKARQRLFNLLGDTKFDLSMPVFLDENYKDSEDTLRYPPPFGMKSVESSLDNVLKVLPESSLPYDIVQKSCRRCIVVGNGGILTHKRLGNVIDTYDVVIRMNNAPVDRFKEDVGTKTTFRFMYPEGSFKSLSLFHPNSTIVFMTFKALDLDWLHSVLTNEPMTSTNGFWKKIPIELPKEPHQCRIFNPAIIQELAFDILKLPINKGEMKKNVPTTGALAIMFSARFCDEISVAGFGYNLKDPNGKLHYYDNSKMKVISKSWTHNISDERKLLAALAQFGVIHDITGGLYKG